MRFVSGASKGWISKLYFLTVSVVLTLSAVGKVVGIWKLVSQSRPSPHLADPLFSFLNVREALLLAAIAEVATVASIWFRPDAKNRAYAVLWLSALFCAYRLGLKAIGFRGYCSCMGYWGSWLKLSPRELDRMALGILGFMVIGGVGIVVRDWFLPKATCGGPVQKGVS